MHCHCDTNNKAPRWTFTDPCKPEVRPGAREELASLAWPAAPTVNARDTTKVYIWRLDTGCWPTLYRKCHSHNTPGKRHNNTWVETLRGELYYQLQWRNFKKKIYNSQWGINISECISYTYRLLLYINMISLPSRIYLESLSLDRKLFTLRILSSDSSLNLNISGSTNTAGDNWNNDSKKLNLV